MTTPGPSEDQEICGYLQRLGLPRIADVHVHFFPDEMLQRIWQVFDRSEETYGRPWPIRYRLPEDARLARLRAFGLAAIPALTYAHKPGVAEWLNAWASEFARRVPDALHCATFYPEPGVAAYVRRSLDAGAQLFKLHLRVGNFPPDDPRLDGVWQLLETRRTPVILHAGSAPRPGAFTGVDPVRRLLERRPDLVLVIAHMGMPEYHGFADLVDSHQNVHLDTTMVATDFTNEFAPLPEDYVPRLAAMADRILFGSDFPNIPYPYAHQLEALARLDLGDDWMRKVLWDNGARLLGLRSCSSD